MLCSFSCTLLLEEWKNSLWINKGIFIFFLGLNCLASFLPKWQRVLNNSCKQSLILPSPSPLLRGTPSSVTRKLVAAGCVLELPKLKSRSRLQSKVSLMGAGLFVCKAPSASMGACAAQRLRACLGALYWGTITSRLKGGKAARKGDTDLSATQIC